MKKKIISTLALCFLLVGCNSGKVLKCSISDKNSSMGVKTTQKYTFDKKGKEVKNVNVIIEYDLTDTYISYLTQNNIPVEEAIDTKAICSAYKMTDDTTCKSSFKDNVLTININSKIDKNSKKKYSNNYDYYKKFFEEKKYECK